MDSKQLYSIRQLRIDAVRTLTIETCTAAEAEDIVQEACLRLIIHQPVFENQNQCFVWFMVVARNIFKDRNRREILHPILSLTNREFTDLSSSSDQLIEDISFQQLMDSLTYSERQILQLKSEGWSLIEISVKLNITESNARKRVQRARVKLKLLLIERDKYEPDSFEMRLRAQLENVT